MRVGQKKTSLTPEERTEALKKWAEAGAFVRKKREQQGISARGLGVEIDVSGNYISEIERGIKPASDPVIREIADRLNFDESDLFKIYGKPTLRAQEELESHDNLNNLLDNIGKTNLNDKEKEKIYKEFSEIAERYLK